MSKKEKELYGWERSKFENKIPDRNIDLSDILDRGRRRPTAEEDRATVAKIDRRIDEARKGGKK